jgi:hypothetical protein
MQTSLSRLKILSSEVVLGTLVAILSVLAAVSGYQGASVDGDQSKYNILGQKKLVDANAEYLSVNQDVVYDYTMYDGWYTAIDDERAEYYRGNFSEELQNAIAITSTEPFSEAYYEAKYASPKAVFDEADSYFKLAEQLDERSGALQYILLISALGLALAAWASLLKDESAMRLVFSVVAIGVLVYVAYLYLNVPAVAT